MRNRFLIIAFSVLTFCSSAVAEDYAPRLGLTRAEMKEASEGCMDCHTKTDSLTMHASPGVTLGCANCHGGDPKVRATGLSKDSEEYTEAKKSAHVLPRHPKNWPTSANPEGSYTDLLKESPEFVKFVNPGRPSYRPRDVRCVSRRDCAGSKKEPHDHLCDALGWCVL